MPLLAREMRAWLSGSPDRVAVLHCKGELLSITVVYINLKVAIFIAGKGRSGTMACTYLLSLDDDPLSPYPEHSQNAKELATIRAEEVMEAIPDNVDETDRGVKIAAQEQQPPSTENGTSNSTTTILEEEQPLRTETPTSMTDSQTTANITSPKSYTGALKDVLDLHTSRRMRAPSSSGKTVKQGVSIPSQRRWLHYWALILANEAPKHLWAIPKPVPPNGACGSAKPPSPKALITGITVRMRESGGLRPNLKKGLVKAAGMVIDHRSGPLSKHAAAAKGGNVWVSLARYDDAFVEMLERWEKRTRDADGRMGKMGHGMGHSELDEIRRANGDRTIREEFGSEGRWDKEKMVRSFARMGLHGRLSTIEAEDKVTFLSLLWC